MEKRTGHPGHDLLIKCSLFLLQESGKMYSICDPDINRAAELWNDPESDR